MSFMIHTLQVDGPTELDSENLLGLLRVIKIQECLVPLSHLSSQPTCVLEASQQSCWDHMGGHAVISCHPSSATPLILPSPCGYVGQGTMTSLPLEVMLILGPVSSETPEIQDCRGSKLSSADTLCWPSAELSQSPFGIGGGSCSEITNSSKRSHCEEVGSHA